RLSTKMPISGKPEIGGPGMTTSAYRQRRQRVDVGHDIDDHRAVGLKSLLDGGTEVAGLLDPDPDRAHVFGDAGEIDLAEGPHLPRLLGLGAAIDAVEPALRLVAAGVVVDHGHGVDAPARRGFNFGDVVPEPGVAG